MAQSPDVRLVTEARLPTLVEELGIGGSGSGIEPVSGTVNLSATGPRVREFYTTAAATIGGVQFPADTALVFSRTAGGAWRYKAVEGWTAASEAGQTLVAAAGPTWEDDSTNGGGTWSTPIESGVIYTPSGKDVAATPRSTVSITAAADAGFKLSGLTSWSHTFPAKPAATYKSEVLADAPILYLPLNEPAGSTTVTNLGTSGGTGTVAAGVTLGAPGLGDGTTSASFSAPAVAAITAYATTTTHKEQSIEFLMNVSGAGTVIDGGEENVFILGGFTNFQAYGSNAGVNGNLWLKGTSYHIVATIDGTTVRYYRNGAQIATVPKDTSRYPRGRTWGLGKGLAGRLSSVAVYDGVLPPDRILAHAQAAGYAS